MYKLRGLGPLYIYIFMIDLYRYSAAEGPTGRSVQKRFDWGEWIVKLFKLLFLPKYDGKELYTIVKNILKEKMLSETLTNVIIPAFDIKLLEPTIFSTSKVTRSLILHVLFLECKLILFEQ